MSAPSKPKDPFTTKQFYEDVRSGRIKLSPYTSVDGEDTTNFYVKSPGKTYGVTVLDMSSPTFYDDLEGYIPATVSQAKEFSRKKYANTAEGKALAAATSALNVPLVGLAPSVLARAGVNPENISAALEYNPGLSALTEIIGEGAAAIASGGTSFIAKNAAELAAEQAAKKAAGIAAEKVAKNTAEVATKDAAQEITKDSIAKKIAGKGLDVFTAPSRALNAIGKKAGQRVLKSLPGTWQGSVIGNAAKSAVDVGAQTAIYGALSGISRRDIAGGNGNEIFAIDAIVQDLMDAGLYGVGGGAAVGVLGHGASKAGNFLKGKVSESAKKIYPWIIGEEAPNGALDAGTRDLFSSAEIEVANALNLKIPQLDSIGVEEFRNFAKFIMGATELNNPNASVFQSGMDYRVNSKRIVDYVDSIGGDIGSIYRQAEAQGVKLGQRTGDLVKELRKISADDGFSYETKYLKEQERIFKEALEPFTNKKPDANGISKVIKDADAKKENLRNSTELSPENKQPILDAVDAIQKVMGGAKTGDRTYTEYMIDSFKEFKKTRQDSLLEGSDSYKANTDGAKQYIKEVFEDARKLNATDIYNIKKRLVENESLFERAGNPVAKKISGKIYTFLNKKLADSIVESVVDPAAKIQMAKNLEFLTKSYAISREPAKQIARRYNMTSMYDKQGLLSRVSELAGGGSPLVGSVAGNILGGPVGAGLGLAAGMLKRSHDEQSKTVFPGIRARRAYAKAGIVVADTQTRGLLGRLERAIEESSSFFEEKKKNKQNRKPISTTILPRTLAILGLNNSSSQEEKEKKVAQYSDMARRQSLGADVVNGSSIADNIYNGFVNAFGKNNEMPDIQEEVARRGKAIQDEMMAILPIGPSFLHPNPYTPMSKLSWRASPIATYQSMRAIQAIQDPVIELTAAASGNINLKALSLVKTGYPAVFDAFLDGIIKKIMANSEKPLTIEQKSVLDILTFGTKYQDDQIADNYNTFKEVGSVQGPQDAPGVPAAPDLAQQTGGKPLTQSAIKNIGRSSKSVRTSVENISNNEN